MNSKNRSFVLLALVFAFVLISNVSIDAQDKPEILAPAAAAKIVPASFYFAGQSAPTQTRNAAVARIGKDRYVVAGLVDTSGYSTEISGKYEGFLITDSPVKIGDEELNTGAYGFGFSKDKLNIFDLSSKLILSVSVTNDAEMKRPRPLMMIGNDKNVRLYKGKLYVVISAK